MPPVDDPGRLVAEQRARVLIDRQLDAAGWNVQDAVKDVAMRTVD